MKKTYRHSPKVLTQFVFILLLIGVPFFFLGGPGSHGSRSFVAIWNLWHVLFFCLFVLILVGIAIFPLTRAVIDEQTALRQFPLLSDFETVFEGDRWKEKELFRVEEGFARHGRHSLKVNLTTDTYSGVSFFYFPGNWQGFESLHVSVYLPDEGKLNLVCRIHDSAHNNEYTDRFNRGFVLEKGWNELVILLADIQHAPVTRLLNMKKIDGLKFFGISQAKERIIYIDHLYLKK